MNTPIDCRQPRTCIQPGLDGKWRIVRSYPLTKRSGGHRFQYDRYVSNKPSESDGRRSRWNISAITAGIGLPARESRRLLSVTDNNVKKIFEIKSQYRFYAIIIGGGSWHKQIFDEPVNQYYSCAQSAYGRWLIRLLQDPVYRAFGCL